MKGVLTIGIRVFFLDGSTKDFDIQTYYKNDNTLYTLVLDNGKYEVVDNVSHMIKLVWSEENYIITEINAFGLKGEIAKNGGKYDVDVSYFGYGNKRLYDILKSENLLTTIEKMRDGDKLVINSSSEILK